MKRGEKYSHFWIEEGILHFVYKPNTAIDLIAAEAIVKERLRFQNGKAYPILCDLRLLKSVNKAAREYLAQQGSTMALAVALIVEESYSGKLSEIFIKISNPSVPTHEFTDIPEALRFLEDYK